MSVCDDFLALFLWMCQCTLRYPSDGIFWRRIWTREVSQRRHFCRRAGSGSWYVDGGVSNGLRAERKHRPHRWVPFFALQFGNVPRPRSRNPCAVRSTSDKVSLLHYISVCIAGFVNLPLSQFEEWGGKLSGEGAVLDAEKDTVVMCHHGMRYAGDANSLLTSSLQQTPLEFL